LRIANDRMAGAMRMVSLARGHDPRDFALFAFGGAGPLHACALARELGIPTVLIPARPGLTNALGCVVADVRHDYVNTVNQRLEEVDPARVRAILEAHVAEGRDTIARESIAVTGMSFIHQADMQFAGQSHLLTVALPTAAVSVDELHTAFARAYWQRFEVELPELLPVLVNLHTAVIGRRAQVSLATLARGSPCAELADAQAGRRPVWFESGWVETPVYRRERLPAAVQFAGPAIVEQLDTTVVIEPGNRVRVDALGNLVITV
jgi:N-methylhydantoinase A